MKKGKAPAEPRTLKYGLRAQTIHSTFNHIAAKAYQVPTCTGTRSPILLRLVCGRTPVATLGMWADPGRAFANGGIVVEKKGCSTLGMKACKHYDGKANDRSEDDSNIANSAQSFLHTLRQLRMNTWRL